MQNGICYVTVLKCFAKEIRVENPEKQPLEAGVSYHASQDLDAYETRMALQGCFSSHWKAMRLSSLDATLDAWVFPTSFFRKSPFSNHRSSMRLTIRLTS